ncbi:ABC-type transport system involved in multi-copper enzyme maturation, permease component [Mesomycoplasma conjunctivae]|uniref:ABC-type transport system involved in multi-copper enzyme maturation, permease component n=1 Tax=Mesomycoplasma conjunctivae (strain ATCC 25834 / NCTC 10147 / HRC/581) TaxID=572263 RepID=C5J5J1_MESCH|nr:ABC transporter permease [Mesomycoplasma conjunctivae]CAT04714.1 HYPOTHETICAL PROTEIN MCJ_000360 [Mesomycoplasma conjunctivae]VEU65705.1 ABC-type transport system involved in multi-copper enzyme maturation, permease component [Mesomycoplasma conjunctivae]
MQNQIIKNFKQNYYFKLLLKLSIKKKAIYIIAVFAFTVSLILGILSRIYATPTSFSIFVFTNLLINLSLTIILASYMFLVIFKDLSSQSIDIVAFTKPYSRKYFIATKIMFLVFVSLVWSIFFYIISIMFFLINFNNISQVSSFYIWSFFSPFFAFLIFGAITGLIGSKFSSKISLSVALVSFSPFILLGSISAFSSTSSPNRFAKILNLPYDQYDSGTIADVDKFFLNDKKDHFFIIPKQVDKPTFSKRQIDYIQQAWNNSSSSAQGWQAASYLLLPYQFLNIFENKDNDALVTSVGKQEKYLENYIFYNNLDSKTNAYEISTNPSLKEYKINENLKAFLIPGALKNQSIFDNLDNRELIYAHKFASDFNTQLPQDEQTFGGASLLVGKLKWQYLKEILESSKFNSYAKDFYRKIKKNSERQQILDIISSAISEDQDLLNIEDENSTVLQKKIDTKKVESDTQRKLYLAVSLIYWLFFNKPESPILDTLLKDSASQSYDPQQFDIKIQNQEYKIGGYSSYSAQQQVVNNKVISRFNLTPSNNFVFQPVSQAIEIKVGYQVVNKSAFIVIWIAISAALLYSLYYLYSRKDYK